MKAATGSEDSCEVLLLSANSFYYNYKLIFPDVTLSQARSMFSTFDRLFLISLMPVGIWL